MRIIHPHPGHRRRRSATTSFDGDAEHYDWVARHLMRGPYRRIAVDAVSAAPPGASVLDVGTGPGRLLLEIARLRADLRPPAPAHGQDRRGKAAVALLVISWQLLTHGGTYTDLGADHFTRRDNPEARADRLTRQLGALGR